MISETHRYLNCRRLSLLRKPLYLLAALSLMVLWAPQASFGQAKKPNILVIFGDDIGQSNISRYTHGLMGMMTPNIDSIGEHGMTFTDYYAENSCTAGRATFITG